MVPNSAVKLRKESPLQWLWIDRIKYNSWGEVRIWTFYPECSTGFTVDKKGRWAFNASEGKMTNWGEAHIYNGILLNCKKNEIKSFIATWMDVETVILSKVSQNRKTNHMISLIGEILNYTNKLVYKTKNRFTNLEIEIMVTRWEGGKLGSLGLTCIRCYIKMGNQKDLLYSTGNFA